MLNPALMTAYFYMLPFIYFGYNKARLVDILLVRIDSLKDSIYIYSDVKGLGEFFWDSCPICGCVSVRTTLWEGGHIEQSECMTCNRMREVMELEELFDKAAR